MNANIDQQLAAWNRTQQAIRALESLDCVLNTHHVQQQRTGIAAARDLAHTLHDLADTIERQADRATAYLDALEAEAMRNHGSE